jgi:antitoxin HicB
MRANPAGDWTIADVEALCWEHGVQCIPPSGGSHYKVAHSSQNVILTIPRRGRSSRFIFVSWSALWMLYVERRMAKLDYPVVIEPLPSHEGGGFVATVPDLPGCMSDGESPEEALANIQDAIVEWIAAAESLGRSVPPPPPRHVAAE